MSITRRVTEFSRQVLDVLLAISLLPVPGSAGTFGSSPEVVPVIDLARGAQQAPCPSKEDCDKLCAEADQAEKDLAEAQRAVAEAQKAYNDARAALTAAQKELKAAESKAYDRPDYKPGDEYRPEDQRTIAEKQAAVDAAQKALDDALARLNEALEKAQRARVRAEGARARCELCLRKRKKNCPGPGGPSPTLAVGGGTGEKVCPGCEDAYKEWQDAEEKAQEARLRYNDAKLNTQEAQDKQDAAETVRTGPVGENSAFSRAVVAKRAAAAEEEALGKKSSEAQVAARAARARYEACVRRKCPPKKMAGQPGNRTLVARDNLLEEAGKVEDYIVEMGDKLTAADKQRYQDTANRLRASAARIDAQIAIEQRGDPNAPILPPEYKWVKNPDGTYLIFTPSGNVFIAHRNGSGDLVVEDLPKPEPVGNVPERAPGTNLRTPDDTRSAGIGYKPQITEPHIWITPLAPFAQGGMPDSVFKAQTFAIRVILPPGAEAPTQISVDVTNEANSSNRITLSKSDTTPYGTLYVSQPIQIDPGKSASRFLDKWIAVENGDKLTATYLNADKPAQTSFLVYDTPLAQAVGRNDRLITDVQAKMNMAVKAADAAIAAIDEKLKTVSDPGSKKKLEENRQKYIRTRDLAQYKLTVANQYFTLANQQTTHGTGHFYIFSDQYKFRLGQGLIPLLLTTMYDRNQAADALDQATQAAARIGQAEFEEKEFQAMQLLALGLYQAVANLTLAGPAFTLLSPIANFLLSPDAVEGGRTFTGTTIWGTVATSDDYAEAAADLLEAYVMMKFPTVLSNMIGKGIAPGYGGETSLFEFPMTPRAKPSREGPGRAVGEEPGLAAEARELLTDEKKLAEFMSKLNKGNAVDAVHAWEKLAREAGVSDEAIKSLKARFDPQGSIVNNLNVARNLMRATLEASGYDVNMTGAEVNQIHGMFVRASTNGAGLTEADIRSLSEWVAADPRFFETLAKRGYLNPINYDLVGVSLQEGFVQALDAESAAILKRAFIRILERDAAAGNVAARQTLAELEFAAPSTAANAPEPGRVGPESGTANVNLMTLTPENVPELSGKQLTSIPRGAFDLLPPEVQQAVGRELQKRGLTPRYGGAPPEGNLAINPDVAAQRFAKLVERLTDQELQKLGANMASDPAKANPLLKAAVDNEIARRAGQAGVVGDAAKGDLSGMNLSAIRPEQLSELSDAQLREINLNPTVYSEELSNEAAKEIVKRQTVPGKPWFFPCAKHGTKKLNEDQSKRMLELLISQERGMPTPLPSEDLPPTEDLADSERGLLGSELQQMANEARDLKQDDYARFLENIKRKLWCEPPTYRVGDDAPKKPPTELGSGMNPPNSATGTGNTGAKPTEGNPNLPYGWTKRPYSPEAAKMLEAGTFDPYANSLNTGATGDPTRSSPIVIVIQLMITADSGVMVGQGHRDTPDGISVATNGLRAPPAGAEQSQDASFQRAAFVPTAFHPTDLDALHPGSIARLVESKRAASSREPSTEHASGGVSFSLVANGNSSGEAFELQVLDPTGKVKQIAMPEGVVLQPLKRGSAQPVTSQARGGANLLTKQLRAYCLDFAKLPPEAGQLYRIADQALQDKFKPMRAVLQAGRQLAASGGLHPDSDPKEYADAIRQYALWSNLENWGEQKFTEMFVERTKKNAQAMNVKWTKQMENALLGMAPGRWRDISMVLAEAQKLSSADMPQAQVQQPKQ